MDIEKILQTLIDYHSTSSSNLHLIPSENQMSIIARLPYITEASYRYSFPSFESENWSWPGNLSMAKIESEAILDIQNMFGAEHVNIKPISGINCMAIAMSAFTQPNSTVFSIGAGDGGHNSTRFLANKLFLNQVDIPFDDRNFCIDFDKLSVEIKKKEDERLFIWINSCVFSLTI